MLFLLIILYQFDFIGFLFDFLRRDTGLTIAIGLRVMVPEPALAGVIFVSGTLAHFLSFCSPSLHRSV